jgi:3-hydroxyisobutyrate dehydrogenase-like beta-hydroxyacid dehydrogenase
VESVRAASERQDVVITMLTDDAALQEVTLSPEGLVASMPGGAVHVAMGTHGVAAIRALDRAHGEAGQRLIAAPVLGRPDLAAAGQLGIVAGGPAPAVSMCMPLFEAIGRRTFLAGERPDAASAIKVANNFILGCAIEAMGEAFSLVRKYGIAPQRFYEVLTDGIFSAPAYQIYGRIIADESYDTVGVTARIGLKDADLALAAADAVQVPLPSGGVWRGRLADAIAHGDGDRDWAVMAREQSRASGLE